MHILAIGCHPDDLELSCFGTLARYVREGHTVVTCHVCNGSLGHVVIKPDELIPLRRQEAVEAARLIGAESRSIGVDDLKVDEGDLTVLSKLATLIREVQPDLIITHDPDDYMRDHVEVSKLAFNASFGASLPHFDATGPVAGLTPICYMDTLAGVGFVPTEYVDISETMDLKLQAVAKHESQIKWLSDHDGIDFLEFVQSCNRARGCQCGVRFAEGFKMDRHHLRQTTRRLLP